MASTAQPQQQAWGGRPPGPPTEEERRQFDAEFKQDFLNEYRKRYGDALISAVQTWELFQTVEDQWHAKMKQRHPPPPHHHGGPPPHHFGGPPPPHFGGPPPPHHGGPPPDFEEKRKQILSDLKKDFEKDFATTHGSSKVNADQAWLLIQKVQRSKHEKFEADRRKHGHHHFPPPPPPGAYGQYPSSQT
ncbi:unnamed protein product [Adineta ricciae]|uniref:Uncharacterized protein n=2 Tax=Adineta ricciae TaxID=249248 RepID=A0A814KDM3_ADIRI|nr:unnamed protein product [Adineta ricciae]